MIRFALLAAVSLATVACAQTTASTAPEAAAGAPPAAAHNGIGVDVAGLNRSVQAGDSIDP